MSGSDDSGRVVVYSEVGQKRGSGKWLLPCRQAATDAQAPGFTAGVHRQLAPSAFIDSAKTEERVDEQKPREVRVALPGLQGHRHRFPPS